MKYQEGDVVLLNNGQTVYIVSVDVKNKEYCAVDTDSNDGDAIYVKESEIYMLVT